MTTYTINKKFAKQYLFYDQTKGVYNGDYYYEVYENENNELVDVVVDDPDMFDWEPLGLGVTRQEYTPTFQKLTVEISIPEGQTQIKEGAFADYERLLKVTLPSTMEIIGSGAFIGCTRLSAINIPDKVTRIEKEAFEHTALQSVVIPPSVVFIGEYAFSGAKRDPGRPQRRIKTKRDREKRRPVRDKKIPSTIKSISFAERSAAEEDKEHAAAERSAAAAQEVAAAERSAAAAQKVAGDTDEGEKVVKRKNHLQIERWAFANARIAEVTLPPNCTVQAFAFCGCKKLKRATIPPGCELITDVFYACYELTDISIPISYAFQSVYGFGVLWPSDLFTPDQQNVRTNMYIKHPGFVQMSFDFTSLERVFFTDHIKTNEHGEVVENSLEKAIDFMKCWRGVPNITYYFSSNTALKIFDQVIKEERLAHTQNPDSFKYCYFRNRVQETNEEQEQMLHEEYYIPWKNVTTRLNYYTSTADVAKNASSEEKKYLNTVFRIMRLGAKEGMVPNKKGENELVPIIEDNPVANDIKRILAINTVHDAILKHITPKTIIMATPVEGVPQESADGGSKE